MKKIINPDPNKWNKLTQRGSASYSTLEPLAKKIFNSVKKNGDEAVLKYTLKFDKIQVENLRISDEEIFQAINNVPNDLKESIKIAKNNIKLFHEAQVTKPVNVQINSGISCWQKKLPIEKVGLYIPGGSAPLFSTILMLAIPAKIANCSEIILCSPPDIYDKLSDVILYTANLCGVDKIFKVGGIQAIAAMTFGTQSIPKVDKIFGPGNQYVTTAKQLSTKYKVAIDMPAGPSELMVVADKTGSPDFIASDLLSQAEHGPDSQVILVSNEIELINSTYKELYEQHEKLLRKSTIKKALNNSKMIYFKKDKDMLDFVNLYAPEHLLVILNDETNFVNKIKHAGSVFIGNYTPESAGDYASGTNHTLPTNGYAKQYSGVNLDSFLKAITYQKITPEGLKKIGPVIQSMANAEGLEAHKNAVSIRLKKLNS